MARKQHDRTLLIIDGSNISYKALFSVTKYKSSRLERPGISEQEKDLIMTVETCRTVCGMIGKILKKWKPTHAVIVFDDNRSSDTFRSKLMPAYKSNRKKKALHKDAYLVFKEVVKSMGVKTVEVPEGYEADDMIGSIANKYADVVDQVYIHSGDKDFYQLVTRKITILDPTNRKSGLEAKLNRTSVRRHFGVWPDQIVDYKALVGDSSDGYAGVPRIGQKTAIELLGQFRHLEKIYSRLDQIQSRGTRRLLEDGKEKAWLCHKLAKIVTDLEVPIGLPELKVKPNQRLYQAMLADLPRLALHTLTYN